MSRITVPPSQEDTDTIDKFKQDILQLYANVKAFRKFFTNALESFTQRGIENNEIPEQAKSLLKKLREHPITYQTFADSVIVHIRLKGEEIQYAGRAMYGVLGASAIAFNACMAMDVPIRGGIDLGFAMNIGSDEIYGPVLASAYHLESKVADYPRIVLGSTLVSYLKEQSDITTTADLEKTNRLLANRCLSLMTTDYDGKIIVDHLGDHIRGILQKIPETSAVVSRARNFVFNEYDKHSLLQNEAERVGNIEAFRRHTLLAGRYEILKKYFEKHLPSWKISEIP